jgi:hypothetical protein
MKMAKRKIWLLVALSLILILILLCTTLIPSIESTITSFPEILLGQVVLSGETKPLSARAYQSAELVLDQVALSEIEQAVFIALYEDVLFWEPQYVGFPRTELNEDEIRDIKQLLSAGNLFRQMPDGDSYQCVSRKPGQEPGLETCAEGKNYREQYVSYQREAEQNHKVGMVQFFLTGGRLAEMRIYPSKVGLAYTPYEKTGDWWFDGVTASSSLFEELSARVTLRSIPVVWPELTASQANTRAARIIGKRYRPALAAIQNSDAVRGVFGEIQEIRPAAGTNYYSAWMDAIAVLLTLRITGSRGEGAVIIQGYDCFDLRMVFKGIPVEDGNASICP